jgi:hypothetical protein
MAKTYYVLLKVHSYSLDYPKGDSQDDPASVGNRYTESNGKARNCVAGTKLPSKLTEEPLFLSYFQAISRLAISSQASTRKGST